MFAVLVNPNGANNTNVRNNVHQHATYNSSSQGTQRSVRSRSQKRGNPTTPNHRLLDSAKSGHRSKIIKGESSVQQHAIQYHQRGPNDSFDDQGNLDLLTENEDSLDAMICLNPINSVEMGDYGLLRRVTQPAERLQRDL